MRKPLASRIAFLAILYCAAFIIIILLQFSNKGNFTVSIGQMIIKGRYSEEEIKGVFPEDNAVLITGGIKISYGGLEFNLSGDQGRGLRVSAREDITYPDPEYIIITETTAGFGLPDGTVVRFTSADSQTGKELQISAEFAEDVSGIFIPITPRRASLVRDEERLGIMFSGSRFFFSGAGQELENGGIALTGEYSQISYRSRERQEIFDPANYITAQAPDYDRIIDAWRDSSYARWFQNSASLRNEEDITAFLSESITRGSYVSSAASISRDFLSGPGHSYISAGYLGGMANAYRLFTADENQNINLITQLAMARHPDIFKIDHVLDYLFSRNNTTLANDIIIMAQGISADMLVFDYCAGLLEMHEDIRRWRPAAGSLIGHLEDRILVLISENLVRDGENDLVFAAISGSVNLEYSLRLGKTLIQWAEENGLGDWIGIGKSLVLSAIAEGGIGNGRLHNILNPTDYYPRAAWLSSPGLLSNTGHWAWTVSPSVRTSVIEGNLDIAVSFPAGMTHHIIIRGIRPFIKLQIHEMDWRTDSQFERYDSSGWVYYPQEQILILKLRHRTTVENIRIFYVPDAPPPAPPEPEPLPFDESEIIEEEET